MAESTYFKTSNPVLKFCFLFNTHLSVTLLIVGHFLFSLFLFVTLIYIFILLALTKYNIAFPQMSQCEYQNSIAVMYEK